MLADLIVQRSGDTDVDGIDLLRELFIVSEEGDLVMVSEFLSPLFLNIADPNDIDPVFQFVVNFQVF